MKTVIDTTGKEWAVTDYIEGGRAQRCQIYPGFVQINLDNAKAVTLPESIAKRWLAGEIRVKV